MDTLGRAVQPRVGQLDASLLDSELLKQLHERLLEGVGVFGKQNYREELLLGLRLLLFSATVWRHSTTYGGQLQNLVLLDTRVGDEFRRPMSKLQKLLYGAVTVGGGYWSSKLQSYLTNADDAADSTKKLRKLVNLVSIVWGASSLASMLAFLFTGRYATLLMRILRIRWAPAQRQSSRAVNYEFQNRQLVWNAATEFLLFVLPLLNISKIQRRVARLLGKNGSANSKSGTKPSTLASLPERYCAICFDNDANTKTITNPYSGECGHPYCYVCISLKTAEDPGWPCLRCDQQIKQLKPWN